MGYIMCINKIKFRIVIGSIIECYKKKGSAQSDRVAHCYTQTITSPKILSLKDNNHIYNFLTSL